MHPPSGTFLIAPPARAAHSPDQPPPIVRVLTWMAAATVTLGLHAGLYLTFTRNSEPPPPPPDSPPAAIMIDMAPIVTTIRSETDNAADGPEADEREAIEEATEPPPPPTPPPPLPQPVVNVPPLPPEIKAEAVLPPTPPQQRIETPPEKSVDPAKVEEVKPELKPELKPQPKPKKPKTEKPKTEKTKKTQPAQTAQKAGGAPRSKQQTGERSAAQSTGGTSANARSQQDWIASVRAKIIRAKRYPSSSRRNREEGVVRVSVTFDGTGAVTRTKVVASSGFDAIDKEAVDVMRRVSFPATPDGKTTTQIFGLNFNLR